MKYGLQGREKKWLYLMMHGEGAISGNNNSAQNKQFLWDLYRNCKHNKSTTVQRERERELTKRGKKGGRRNN